MGSGLGTVHRVWWSRWTVVAACLGAALPLPIVAGPIQTDPAVVPGWDAAWNTQDGRHRLVESPGDPHVAVRGAGAQLETVGLELGSGTVTFDVRFNDNSRFGGVAFRRTAADVYETIYLRPHHSGAWDALQYQAAFGGGTSSWQIYSEFNAQADLPLGAWIPVRLELNGPRIEFYLHGNPEPTLVVPRARGLEERGGLSFWATEFDPNGRAALEVRDVRIAARSAPPVVARPTPPAPGVIDRWVVSQPISIGAADLPLSTLPAGAHEWSPVPVEEDGLVNLSRWRGRPEGSGMETVLGRTILNSPDVRVVGLDVGFSNGVTVFLNGAPIYSGYDDWEGRYPGYFAGVRFGFETAWLPLRAGDNELILAVSEEGSFGWGFKARLLDAPEVSVEGRRP